MTALETNFTAEDISKVRAETPGLPGRIHLDNCGSSLVPRAVVDAQMAHLSLEVEVGGYVAQEQQSVPLAKVYDGLARLLGGKPTDFALVGSAVDGWTKAFYSVPLKAGDNIVTAYNEYCSNYVAYLQRAKRDGIEIRVARPDEDGKLDLDHLEGLIDKRTRLISLTHVPSSSGQIAPAEDVGKIAQAHNILYLLDACQSVGQMSVNFEDIGCDMATGTGRKFLRGPRGIGFLYINEKARRQIDLVVLTNQAATWTTDNSYQLRSDAGVFEAWERSCINQLGFGAAIDYLLGLGIAKTAMRTLSLTAHLRTGLANIPGVIPTCQKDATAAIVTFNKQGWTAAAIKAAMEEQGIATQVASVVHTRLDLGARGIDTTARISPHYYNTVEELDRFLNVLESL
jgi:cysteine desulfurase / selenocysteine lyase